MVYTIIPFIYNTFEHYPLSFIEGVVSNCMRTPPGLFLRKPLQVAVEVEDLTITGGNEKTRTGMSEPSRASSMQPRCNLEDLEVAVRDNLQDIKSPNTPVFLWRGIGVFTSFGLGYL